MRSEEIAVTKGVVDVRKTWVRGRFVDDDEDRGDDMRDVAAVALLIGLFMAMAWLVRGMS